MCHPGACINIQARLLYVNLYVYKYMYVGRRNNTNQNVNKNITYTEHMGYIYVYD